MITPDSPDRLYSTRLRTALVLTGSGTAGAYHAGVLRALHEAGIKVDLAAGRGIGGVGAMFAAVDGGARLWEQNGLWRSPDAARYYGWRTPLRAAGWVIVGGAAVLTIPLLLLALAVVLAIAGLLLTLVGLSRAAAWVTATYTAWIGAIFEPARLPTVIPRLALLAMLIAAGIVIGGVVWGRVTRGRRRADRGTAARAFSGPLSPVSLTHKCVAELWNLIRGAAPVASPEAGELGRRYLELLGENLGQPGFRELLVSVHDMDARRDLVFALLNPKLRPRFFSRPAPADGSRQLEAFDLGGASRDHALDVLTASLAMPMATEPHLVAFAPEGPWRGEMHRVCDRPGALTRLMEEVAAAGAEQVVLVSASPLPAKPHELSPSRSDPRGRAGEQLAAFESASLRDTVEHFTGRFAGLFVIRPVHNPLGPLDFGGVYDDRSDRTHTVPELLDRGYEDAYRQFIEPVVGASGERIATVQ